MVDEANNNETDVDVNEQGNSIERDVQETPTQKQKLETRRQTKSETRDEPRKYDENYVFELKQESIEHRKESQEHKKRATQLEKQIADLQKQFESSREEFKSAFKQQQDRIVKATLSSALTKAGCVDSDTAMSLLVPLVEFSDEGDVKNGEDLVNDLKKSKAYFFTGPATSNPSPTPRPRVVPNDVSTMDNKAFQKLLQNMGVKMP